MRDQPKPPEHLSVDAQAWWGTVAATFSLEPHHLNVLTVAGESWDRMNQAREILAEDGPVYRNRFGDPCKHPAVSIEQDARMAFLRSMKALDLDDDGPAVEVRSPLRSA